MTRWMSARQAAEHLGYGPGRRGVRALYQATYRIPMLRACVVALDGTKRGLRFDRERIDAYLELRQIDWLRLQALHDGIVRRPRRVAGIEAAAGGAHGTRMPAAVR